MCMDIIYIDELFALNFIIDYLLLLLSARVCGVMLRRWRYAAGALLGALFACFTALPGFELFKLAAAKLGCGALMALIAFWGEAAILKCGLVFWAVSAAFGGAVWCAGLLTGPAGAQGLYAPMSTKALVISFALCYGVVSLVFRRSLKNAQLEILTVAAGLSGRQGVFHALRDTGNSLYDPLSGAQVIIISPEAAQPLFPPECKEILLEENPIALMEGLNLQPEISGKIRLIPYSAIGVASGLLPVFRPDSLLINDKARDDVLIAISPVLSGKCEYEAIF